MNGIRKHLKSYVYAFRGIWMALRLESNMKLHLLATLAVIVVNYLLDVKPTDWVITLLLIGIVWMAEMFNTAFEKLSDRVNPEHDELIKQVKDLAAGAVLVVCIVAVICAMIIYYPYVVPGS